MFADVAGSVGLYDAIGDSPAHQKIVECLNQMTAVIKQFRGRVVEIIGDEIMAAFPLPVDAFEASCEIQNRLMQGGDSKLGVRVGFHCGLTAETDGHPYGDTVNIAARMVNLAKSGQIVINHETLTRLSDIQQARVRYVDRVFLKGKKRPYTVHEVLWEEAAEYTMVVKPHSIGYTNRRHTESSLFLRYGDEERQITEAVGELTLGRGQRCDLIICAGAASRLHGTVSYHKGKMVFKDQSTNGTFIRTVEGKRSADGLDLFVHHEEWVSDSDGMLSLGEPVTEGTPHLLYFRMG